MHLIRQFTASTVTVGPVLDSTGAAVTSAVVGDFRISKNGTTATLSGATVTHDANGYYNIALTTGNTDTAGRLVLFSGNSAQSMGAHRFTVLLPSVFDALIANATNSTGGLPTATAAISAFAGVISTFAGGPVQSVTNRVTANVDQWNGVTATGMPMPTYIQPTGFLTATFPATVASPTNITSASGVVLAGVTHTGAVIPTVTDVTTKTGYTATVSDKTGFSLLPTTGLGNQSGTVGGISGVSFPANFSLLSITSAGAIASVINVLNVDELAEGALIANGAVDAIPPAVWNALTTTTYTDQSFGDRLLISTNNTRTVAVTGSGHVAAVLHDAEPNSIPEDAFVNGAVSARVIAADAIDGDAMASSALTEIANAVGALQVLVDMGVMIINDGTANARFSVSALQNAPAGEGGSQTINVYPVSASTPERVAGTTITFYRNESRTVSVVTDFTLTALTLVFVIEDSEGNDLLTIADGSITRSDKTFTVSIGTTVTATISNYRWALRDITSGTNSVIARGVFSVQEAASNA